MAGSLTLIRDGPLRVWRASSYEVTLSRSVMPRGRPTDRSQASRCGSRILGQAAPGKVTSAGGAEVGVDLAGDVALELSWSSRCGEKLLAAVS
jgi:hypothetical protein